MKAAPIDRGGVLARLVAIAALVLVAHRAHGQGTYQLTLRIKVEPDRHATIRETVVVPMVSVLGLITCSQSGELSQGMRPAWHASTTSQRHGLECTHEVTMRADDFAMLAEELRYLARGSPFPIVLTTQPDGGFAFDARVSPARAMGVTQDLTLVFTVPQITRISGGEPFLFHSGHEAAWHFPPQGSYQVRVEARPEPVNSKAADVLFPPMPSETELLRNICTARDRYWLLNLASFYSQFTDKGPMDYKRQNRRFEPFGNFNYGAFGAAAGWWTTILLNEAGRNQMQPGKPHDPAWGKPGPWWWPWACTGNCGDDPRDQEWIKQGIAFYESLDKTQLEQQCRGVSP